MIITANGSYLLRDKKRSNVYSRTAVYISGDFGGATALLVYHNSSGTAIPLEDGALSSGQQKLVNDGVEADISIVVSGASDTTAIDVISRGVI